MNWNEKENRTVYIYVLFNVVEKIAYIGQTADPERRKKDHFEKPMKAFEDDMKKFGKKAFRFKVIDECAYRHRYIVEAWWTRKYAEKYALYNVKHGQYHVESTKHRLSEALQGLTSGENNPMYGHIDDNATNGKHVYMKDKDGNVIKEFVSVKMAMKYLNLKGHGKLYEACKTGEEYKGYYWSKDITL